MSKTNRNIELAGLFRNPGGTHQYLRQREILTEVPGISKRNRISRQSNNPVSCYDDINVSAYSEVWNPFNLK